MTARHRAEAFCELLGLRAPILMAPMAGACPPPLAAAIASAGGMGGFGALMSSPAQMRDWAAHSAPPATAPSRSTSGRRAGAAARPGA